ncbi:MAG: alpha/beta fold hydrolase [Dehalococcoidia bacterium]
MLRRTILGLGQTEADGEAPPSPTSGMSDRPHQTGYVPVNSLQMYYEVHGTASDGVPPLLLLHGALGTLNMFGPLLPALAQTRPVIAVEQQGHGRTADIDRPLRYEQMADDTAALLDFLGVDRVDVFGFSMGGGVAWQLVIRHPDLVRKLVAGSASYTRAHGYAEAIGGLEMTFSPEMFAGTPIEADYLRVAPHPANFPSLVLKVQQVTQGSEDMPAEVIWAIAAPTMIIVGDADIIRPEGAAELFRMRGGGVPGDFVPTTPARLAVLPGTTHMTLPTRTEWLRSMIAEFLDAPMSGTE